MKKRILATPWILVYNNGASNHRWFGTPDMRDALKKYHGGASS